MSLVENELRLLYRQALEMMSQEITAKDWAVCDIHNCYLLSGIVINRTLGPEWWELHIAPLERPTGYFRPNPSNPDLYYRFQSRVIELAEMILNLQAVEGFDHRLDSIRSDQRGIESGIGELMGGRFFRCLGLMFRFVNASGRKQDDYDIDYVRTDGKFGRCEVKSKLPATELSNATLWETLKSAKSQLPKGQTGVVLLRIPEEWIPWSPLDVGVARLRTIEEAIRNWFEKQKTTRISSVILLASESQVQNECVSQVWHFKDYPNINCKDISGLPKLPKNEYGHCLPPGNWIKIPELIRKWAV
jgi:hypothetical protein